jgi:hypothetical protein
VKKRTARKPKPRARRKAPVGVTPNACFLSGVAVTTAEFRALHALDAIQKGNLNAARRELGEIAKSMETAHRAAPACKVNHENVENLVRRPLSDAREGRQRILQLLSIISSCADKVRDRCMTEQIPDARATIKED